MAHTRKSYGSFEIAKICDVKPVTVYRWITAGRLRAHRTGGGHYRVWEDDLQDFLETLDISMPGAAAHKTTKILVVDDEVMVRRLVSRLIQKTYPKALIYEAVDGYEAGFKTRDIKPSLVILDLRLPCLDGTKVCRMIKKESTLKDTKILVITGYEKEKAKRIVLKAGADDFLTKPFKNEEFIERLKHLLVSEVKSKK